MGSIPARRTIFPANARGPDRDKANAVVQFLAFGQRPRSVPMLSGMNGSSKREMDE